MNQNLGTRRQMHENDDLRSEVVIMDKKLIEYKKAMESAIESLEYAEVEGCLDPSRFRDLALTALKDAVEDDL